MKIEIARFIDYWLGIPICLLLSILNNAKSLFTDKNKERPKKILFLEFSEMGSAILAYFSMRKVKEMHPEAELFFWTFRRNRDGVFLLNIMPSKNVIVMRDDNLLFLFIGALLNLWRCRREKIDTIIDMELFSRCSSILSYLSGAKIRVGFHKFSMEGLFRGNLHTHKVMYNPYMHISKNFLSLVSSLNESLQTLPFPKVSFADFKTTVPKIKSTEEAQRMIWNRLKKWNPRLENDKGRKIVILNPGTNKALPLRGWPIENYINLTEKLLVDNEIFIILIGTREQATSGIIITEKIRNSRIIDSIGKTSVNELIDLFNVSSLLISHDSGATNLASLTNIHILVMFGLETPELYAPLTDRKVVLYANLACSPCVSAYNHRRSVCNDNICMKAITVDKVYSLARKYLSLGEIIR